MRSLFVLFAAGLFYGCAAHFDSSRSEDGQMRTTGALGELEAALSFHPGRSPRKLLPA
jgi:hypothetical protein